MGVKKYDIKEAAFDPTNASNYELSILLGVGSFTYVIREERTKDLMVYRSLALEGGPLVNWSKKMHRTTQEDEVLRPSLIRKTYVGWITPRVTLVPTRLFQDGQEAAYMSALTTIGLDDHCRSDAMPALGTQLVYAIGQERVDSVTRRFAPLRARHYAAHLLKAWQDQSRRIGHRAVYASLRDGQITLATLDAGKLLMFNVFAYQTAQDALYYVTLCFQQSGWGLDRVPLYLCGEILSQSEVYRQLYRFIEDIRFLSTDNLPGIAGPILSAYPGHLYYDLLCQFS